MAITWATTPSLGSAQIAGSTYLLKDVEGRGKIEYLDQRITDIQTAGLVITELLEDPQLWIDSGGTQGPDPAAVDPTTGQHLYYGKLCLYASGGSESGIFEEWIVITDSYTGTPPFWEKIGTTKTDLDDYLGDARTTDPAKVAGIAFPSSGTYKHAIATSSLKTALGLDTLGSLAWKDSAAGTVTISAVVTGTQNATATFTGSVTVATGVTGTVGVVPNTTNVKIGDVTNVTASTTELRVGQLDNVTATSTAIKFGDVTGVTKSTAQAAIGSVKEVTVKTSSVKIGDVTGVAAVNTNYTVATNASAVTKAFTVGGTQGVSATVSGECLVFSINTQSITVATSVSVQTKSIAAATSVSVTKQNTAISVATDVSVTKETNKTTFMNDITVNHNTTNAQTILTGITTTSAAVATLVTGVTPVKQTSDTLIATGIATATFTGSLQTKSTQVSVDGTYVKPKAATSVSTSVTVS